MLEYLQTRLAHFRDEAVEADFQQGYAQASVTCVRSSLEVRRTNNSTEVERMQEKKDGLPT
jgi:hypothetical protein